jgi:hypothetical protein
MISASTKFLAHPSEIKPTRTGLDAGVGFEMGWAAMFFTSEEDKAKAGFRNDGATPYWRGGNGNVSADACIS